MPARGRRARSRTTSAGSAIVHVAGVDEVGRGCLAGPVVAGAVVLRPEQYVRRRRRLEGAHGRRSRAALRARSSAPPSRGTSRSSSRTKSIASTSIAPRSRRCAQAVMALVPLPGFVLVDGFRIPDLLMAQRPIIGGDRRVHGDRRRVDPRQGHARSADGRAARARSALRLRSPQGLRDARSSRRGRAASATRPCIAARSGRRRCLIRFPTDAQLPRRGASLIRFVTRLLVAAYLVEAGLVLTVAPWTAFWDRNYFAHALAAGSGRGWRNAYVRGAVTRRRRWSRPSPGCAISPCSILGGRRRRRRCRVRRPPRRERAAAPVSVPGHRSPPAGQPDARTLARRARRARALARRRHRGRHRSDPDPRARSAGADARRLASRVVVARRAATPTRVLVNDRADVALAAGADGVHLRADGPPASRGARARSAELDRSAARSITASRSSVDRSADYLLFGTVFPAGSKPADAPPAGLEALARAPRRRRPCRCWRLAG